MLHFVLLTGLLVGSPLATHEKRPVGLISQNDYPAEAVRLGQQGTVRVRLRISAEGRVSTCSIIESAGSALDRATCQVLTQRARFTPGTDAAGKAIEWDFEQSIRWVLPGRASKPQGLRL